MRAPRKQLLVSALSAASLAIVACNDGKPAESSGPKSAKSAADQAAGAKVKSGLSLHGFDLEKGALEGDQDYGQGVSRFKIQVLDGEDPVLGAKISIVRLEATKTKGKFKNSDSSSIDGDTTNQFTLFVGTGRDYMIFAEAPKHGKIAKHIVIDSSNPVHVDFPLQFNTGDEVMGTSGSAMPAEGYPNQDPGSDVAASSPDFVNKGLKYCDIGSGDFKHDMEDFFQVLDTGLPNAGAAVRKQLKSGAVPLSCSGAKWPSVAIVFKVGAGKTVRLVIDDASQIGAQYYSDGGSGEAGSSEASSGSDVMAGPPPEEAASGEASDDSGAGAGGVAAASGSDDDNGTCKDASGGASAGNNLGSISGESTDLDFKAKSVYAMKNVSSGFHSLSFVIYSEETKESMFRKIKSWECKKKCDPGTHAAPGSIYLTFMPSFTKDPAHKVDDTAYPKQDANHKAGLTDQLAGMSISYSGNTSATNNTGDFNFTAGKRPAKTGDEFEVTADLHFQDGKSYKAKLKGKVYEMPAPPTPPTCKEDEMLNPIFE